MTTDEAVEFAGVTRQTLQDWLAAGKVKALLVLSDGRWRRDWDRESLAAAIAPRGGETDPKPVVTEATHG